MNDDLVNLRRVQLMAEDINQKENDGFVFSTCDRLFKEKKHLLRHNRTVHTDPKDYQCSVCFSHFKRKDSLNRHMKSHIRQGQYQQNDAYLSQGQPLKTSNDNTLCVPTTINSTTNRKRQHRLDESESPPAKLSRQSTSPGPTTENTNATIGKCIWCTQNKALLPNKTFCATCGDQGRECNWCHRPLPERFFSLRVDICDRCITRRQNWTTRQQQGGGKVKALEETAQTESLEPNAGNLWDILQIFVDNREQIGTILTDRLSNVKGMK